MNNSPPQLDNSGQKQSREVSVKEDKTIVETTAETTLNPEQTVQRYNQTIDQVRNRDKTITAYEDKIDETLEEHGTKMQFLHTVVDEHPQKDLDISKEDMPDLLSNQDLQRYHNLQEMHDQCEKIRDTLGDGVQDLYDLYQAARTMADRHGFELEAKPEEIEEELENY